MGIGTGKLSYQRCRSHLDFAPRIWGILELGGHSGWGGNNGLHITMSTSPSSFPLTEACKTFWDTHENHYSCLRINAQVSKQQLFLIECLPNTCPVLQISVILTALYNKYYLHFTRERLRPREIKCSIQEHNSTEKKQVKDPKAGLSPRPLLFPQNFL